MSDPICGNCGNPYSDHYFERETYCYPDTNGDIYTDEPSHQYVLDQMHERWPDLYEQVVTEWQAANGHAPNAN